MRLDHLLSKEGQVEVVLLFSEPCGWTQGLTARSRGPDGTGGQAQGEGPHRDEAERNRDGMAGEKLLSSLYDLRVAMRLGETPVPIPNTMVKP